MDFTSLYDLNNTIEAMQELAQHKSTEKGPEFLRPFHFVMLGLTLKQQGAESLEIENVPDDVLRYASRMGLWDAIGLTPPISVNAHSHAGRFHPLTPLNCPDTVQQVSADLAKLFTVDTPESVASIDAAVTELVGNAYAHSEPSDGFHGLVCAQTWPGGKKAQIAIGDSGIGIRASLSRSDEYKAALATENSCKLATEYDVTSKRGKGHSGYGLTLARDLISANGGAFFLLSDKEYFYVKNGMRQEGRLDIPIQGTLVVMEWNTQVPLSAREVYDSWPNIPGHDYDDIDI